LRGVRRKKRRSLERACGKSFICDDFRERQEKRSYKVSSPPFHVFFFIMCAPSPSLRVSFQSHRDDEPELVVVLVVFLVLQSLGHDDNELRSSSLWFLVIL
jgi:hypothetical protein